MGRERRGFRTGKRPADLQHDILGIVAASPGAPLVELLGEIGSRLAAKRRIGRADPFAARAVARGAGSKTARRIATMIETGNRLG